MFKLKGYPSYDYSPPKKYIDYITHILYTVYMLVRQAELRHEDTRMVSWLDDHPKLAVGKFVTLKKKDERRWEVLSLSEPVEANSIKKTFDNNNYDKHTGLKYNAK